MATKTKAIAHTKESVPLAELHPHPENYRSHPADQLEHLAASIRENGQYRNLVIANDGTILAGHGVYEALQLVGLDSADVVRLDLAPDDPRAIKILVADNEVGRLAEIDDRRLTEHLRALSEIDALLGTGFDDKMLATLVFVTRHDDEIGTIDEAAQWVGLPGFDIVTDDPLLVIHFDSDEDRATLIGQLELVISKKTRQTWSSWWPTRDRGDPGSLRFD